MTLAAGGLAFANIFGFAATAMSFGGESASDTAPVRTTMHIGWVFGVFIALFGAIMQRRSQRRKRTTTETGDDVKHEDEIKRPTPEPQAPRRRRGFLISAAWGGFFGGLLGTWIGASLILLWFSLTYSPFAPQDWVASVSVEHQRVGTSARKEPVAVSDHPVALYAFGLPLAIGVFGGALFGGIVRVSEEETDPPNPTG